MKAAARAEKRRADDRQQLREDLVARRKEWYGRRQRLAARARWLRWEPCCITARARRRLSRRERLEMGWRQYRALLALVDGRGQVMHAQILAGASNMAVILCQWGLGSEHEFVVVTAQRLIATLHKLIRNPAPGKPVRPTDPVGQPGTCPLDAAGVAMVADLLAIHAEQLDHQDCTRLLLSNVQAEVLRRQKDRNVVDPDEPQRHAIGPDGKPVLLANVGGDVAALVEGALRRLRELVLPAADEGGELPLVIASIETYFAVSQRVLMDTPADVLRQAAIAVAEESRVRAAKQSEGAVA